MDRERKLLYLFISIFGVLLLLLGWQFYFHATAFFPSGTRPAIADQTEVKPTKPPLREGDPVRGSSDPEAVTIIEFADFTCIYCRAIEREIVQVLQQNPEVRHVWRDMPVASDTPEGMIAAVAGRCAKDQGKFWDMHNLLIQADIVTLDEINKFANTINLNETEFNTCMASNKHVSDIQEDISIAKQHNLTAAPTLFIGNEVISGFAKASEIRWAVLRAKWAK